MWAPQQNSPLLPLIRVAAVIWATKYRKKKTEQSTWKYAARGEWRKSFLWKPNVSHKPAVKAQRLNVSTLQRKEDQTRQPRTQRWPTASCVQQPPLRTAAAAATHFAHHPSLLQRRGRAESKRKKKKHRQQGTNEEWKTSPNCKVWRRQGEKINNFSKGGLQWRTHVEARKCGLLALNVA